MWSRKRRKTAFCGASVSQRHIAGDFTFEHYKHIDSRRCLILDAEGHCYGRQGEQLVPVDFQEELRQVTEAVGV